MKKRNRIACRLVSMALTAVMAVSGFTPAVFADSTESNGAEKESISVNTGAGLGQKSLTLNQAIKKWQYEDRNGDDAHEGETLDDKVIVLFDDEEKLTKKAARKALKSGDSGVSDIRIEQVWNFDKAEADGTKAEADGKYNLASEEAQDEPGALSVAMVSSDSMSGHRLMKQLKNNDAVKYAERNHKVHALSVSNDAYSDYQWSMKDGDKTPNVSFQWNTKKITGSRDKVVAVVDTGIDYTHPDLKDRMWENTHYPELKGTCGYDFFNGDGDPKDDNGHGTHCAGIIGAAGNNGVGISGVNQDIRFMALKILNEEGSAELSHEISAYNYINDALDLGEPIAAINNSWGGAEESEIMRELIDLVGEKGAITICAAGNEASKNDEEPTYPSDYDSDYIISVAATNRAGELATFSNYGEAVDVAAPGCDILSSVSYYSYNPTIYDDAKQSKITEDFNSFDDPNKTFGVPAEDNLYIDGKLYTEYVEKQKKKGEDEEDIPSITYGAEDGDFIRPSGKSLNLTLKNMPKESLICYTIPYKADVTDIEKNPTMSLMVKACGPESDGFFGSSLFGIVSTPKDTVLDVKNIGDKELSGFPLMGEENSWNHVVHSMKDEADMEAGEDQEFVVLIYAYEAGDYTIQIDDVGVSKKGVAKEEFEKYDFFSGTSMAAPFITGSVVLKTLEMQQNTKADEVKPDSADVINEITSCVNVFDPELPIASGGMFDFSKQPKELAPRISKLTVDPDKKEVKIWGSSFVQSSGGIKVEFETERGGVKEAKIKEKTNKYIIVEDNGWINNIVDVKVTSGSRSSVRRGIYLVKGKKEYEKVNDSGVAPLDEAMTSDGNFIYALSSPDRAIYKINPEAEESSELIGEVDTDQIFNVTKDEKKNYGMLFGQDIAHINGVLYSTAEYGAAEESEYSGDIFDWSVGKMKIDRGKLDDEDDEGGTENNGELIGNFAIYSGVTHLLKTDAMGGTTESLGELPDALKKTEYYTMAAYNGKLYFIGGHSYDGGDKGLVKTVKIFDPKTEKWSDGPELPEAREGGKAVQTGDKLVYTASYDSEDDERIRSYDTFVFDGKTWTKTELESKVKAFDEELEHDLSIVKGGVLLTGAPVSDFGDTFSYDIAAGAYKDTGYNLIKTLDEFELRSIAVGDKLYALSEDGILAAPVESGFIKIDAAQKGKGKISGTGWVAPGNDAKVKIKAEKHYHIKSIKVGSKKIKIKKKAKSKEISITRPMKDQKIKVVFARDKRVKVKVKKTGKGKIKVKKRYYVGQKVKIIVKASKGYYIKSFKVGKKSVKLKGKLKKKVYVIKKIKKNTKVKVVFAKK